MGLDNLILSQTEKDNYSMISPIHQNLKKSKLAKKKKRVKWYVSGPGGWGIERMFKRTNLQQVVNKSYRSNAQYCEYTQ